MGSLIRIDGKEKRFVAKELTYDNGEILYSHIFILLKGKPFEVEDTIYTKFFRDKSIINLSIETKRKTYARCIVPFLNYIFFESENKISNIGDLTLELCNNYLNDYSDGILGKVKERKAGETVDKHEVVLTSFIKWLCIKSGVKMKNFKRSIFNDGKSIFTVSKSKKKKRRRLEDLTFFMVTELIKTAQEYDRMLAFAIGLQAFAGLRAGDICQMTFDRINFSELSWDSVIDEDMKKEIHSEIPKMETLSAYIDLQEEYILRSDGLRTSGIKIHRIQPIFEGYLPIIKQLYFQHKKFLKQKNINNKYNAMFVNNRGTAMTLDSYLRRFDNLIYRLIERINMLSAYNKDALQAKLLLESAPLKSHSLRYFYTNSLGPFITNPHQLAMYRGDRNINSALTYLRNSNFTKSYIKEIQDSFAKVYEDICLI